MNLKRILTLTLLFVVLATACSCGVKDASIPSPQYDADGVYAGFSDIPENYNADMAIKDGCVVISHYTVSDTQPQIATGYKHFEQFMESAQNGQDCFVRAAHFIDGIGYYTDLYYHDGKYIHFKYDEYGISEGKSFTYLRRLESEYSKGHCYYVLTDSLELAYHDVSWSYLASNPSTVTKIPFVWLGFTTYYN